MDTVKSRAAGIKDRKHLLSLPEITRRSGAVAMVLKIKRDGVAYNSAYNFDAALSLEYSALHARKAVIPALHKCAAPGIKDERRTKVALHQRRNRWARVVGEFFSSSVSA